MEELDKFRSSPQDQVWLVESQTRMYQFSIWQMHGPHSLGPSPKPSRGRNELQGRDLRYLRPAEFPPLGNMRIGLDEDDEI